MTTDKKCIRCGTVKPLEAFHLNIKGRRLGACRACTNARSLEHIHRKRAGLSVACNRCKKGIAPKDAIPGEVPLCNRCRESSRELIHPVRSAKQVAKALGLSVCQVRHCEETFWAKVKDAIFVLSNDRDLRRSMGRVCPDGE